MSYKYNGPFFLSLGESDCKIFGGLVQNLREMHELTRVAVASYIGVSEEFVRSIEIGRRAPSRATAKKMLELYQVKGHIDWVQNGQFDVAIEDPATGVMIAFTFNRKHQQRSTQGEGVISPEPEPLMVFCDLDILNADQAIYRGPSAIKVEIPRDMFEENGRPFQVRIVIPRSES